MGSGCSQQHRSRFGAQQHPHHYDPHFGPGHHQMGPGFDHHHDMGHGFGDQHHGGFGDGHHSGGGHHGHH
jgi:hypothetical protein